MKLPVHTQTNPDLIKECQRQRISSPLATFKMLRVSIRQKYHIKTFYHLKKKLPPFRKHRQWFSLHTRHHLSMWFSAKWAIEVSQCWGLVHAGMWDVLTGSILTGLCIRSSMTSLTGRPRTSTLQLVMLPWAFSNALLRGNGGPLGHFRYSVEIMVHKQHKCMSSEFRCNNSILRSGSHNHNLLNFYSGKQKLQEI